MALVPAPTGTTTNKLIVYPPGSVTAPASGFASATGYQNISSKTNNHQVPQ
jgi:hypothetical protein